MRGRGIEPRPFAWQAKIIPLNQPREVNTIKQEYKQGYYVKEVPNCHVTCRKDPE